MGEHGSSTQSGSNGGSNGANGGSNGNGSNGNGNEPVAPPPRRTFPPPGIRLDGSDVAADADALPGDVLRRVGAYHSYAQVMAKLEDWARASDAVRLETIGTSHGGEPLRALMVGPGPEDARGVSVVLSTVHPMEWIGIEAHLRLLERLVGRPPKDLLVVSVPVVNPDGYKAVEQNLRDGRRRFVRHNGAGVDLNRNWPAFWDKRGLSTRLAGRFFARGKGPGSEPEVSAITTLLGHRRVERALSLHSFGGTVLFPFGSRLAPTPRFAEHSRWAESIAKRIDSDRPYKAVQCSRWVPGLTSSGMELDWFHEQGAISLLVECSRGGVRLKKPKSLLEPFQWFNPRSPGPCAERIAAGVEPYVRGEEPGG